MHEWCEARVNRANSRRSVDMHVPVHERADDARTREDGEKNHKPEKILRAHCVVRQAREELAIKFGIVVKY